MLKWLKRRNKERDIFNELALTASLLSASKKVLIMFSVHRNEEDHLVKNTKKNIKEYEDRVDELLNQLDELRG